MEAKHTLGPWTLEREVFADKMGVDPKTVCSEVQHNGYTIGYWVPTEWTGHCPDARLIAAAPELLAALRGMLEWARRVHQRNPGMEVANAMAAIDKAEGK